jgi:hypothetical protein
MDESTIREARLIRTVDVVRHESNYLAITAELQELLRLGRSRSAAMQFRIRQTAL